MVTIPTAADILQLLTAFSSKLTVKNTEKQKTEPFSL